MLTETSTSCSHILAKKSIMATMARSSMGRILAFQASRSGFEPHAGYARPKLKWEEQRFPKPKAEGPNPSGRTEDLTSARVRV
jgi:hypothetical protein